MCKEFLGDVNAVLLQDNASYFGYAARDELFLSFLCYARDFVVSFQAIVVPFVSFF